MQGHPEHSDDPEPRSNKRGILIAILIAVLLVVVVTLHLTGVVGAGSH